MTTKAKRSFESAMRAPIIQWPSDNDYYKYTMKAGVFRWYSDAEVEYALRCRSEGVDLSGLIDQIRAQVKMCGELHHRKSTIEFLRKQDMFSESYLRFLRMQRLNPEDVAVTEGDQAGIDIRIKGPWLHTIDWEIYLLRIISTLRTWEAYKDLSDEEYDANWKIGADKLHEKCDYLTEEAPGLGFVDMGTRRAASPRWHEAALLEILDHYDLLIGTSNVLFAKKHNIKVFGTQAHEWDSAHLAFTNPLNAKILAMQRWLDTFGGKAGITLTDTFTTDFFLKCFNKKFANAFDGGRHDSGHWETWAQKMMKHYEGLDIDPKTKNYSFSDSLDEKKMVEIWRYFDCGHTVPVGFGIGTNLVNDVTIKPAQIVIKMVKCNGQDVLKLSDDVGKVTCDNDEFVSYFQSLLRNYS